jgi:hypothetical protein
MDRGGRLVDLDEGSARLDQGLELGAEDRHEGLRDIISMAVDLAGSRAEPAGQGVGARQRHLERARRPGRRVPVLRHHAQARGSRDGLDDLDAVLLIVTTCADAPLGRERPDAGEVTVELGGEEACPPHLAITDDVDASLLLVAQGQVDRVIEHLGEIGGTELASFGGLDAGDEPRRPGMRADDAGAELTAHPAVPSLIEANANSLAGLVTNIRERTVSLIPASSRSRLKPSSSQARPGRPPNTW